MLPNSAKRTRHHFRVVVRVQAPGRVPSRSVEVLFAGSLPHLRLMSHLLCRGLYTHGQHTTARQTQAVKPVSRLPSFGVHSDSPSCPTTTFSKNASWKQKLTLQHICPPPTCQGEISLFLIPSDSANPVIHTPHSPIMRLLHNRNTQFQPEASTCPTFSRADRPEIQHLFSFPLQP